MSDDEMLQLLDDCHNALAKSALDMPEYSPLSFRLIDAKNGLREKLMNENNAR